MNAKYQIAIATLLLASFAHAWSPGAASPEATSALTVDAADRNDVLSFYQHIYQASENYASIMAWTGSLSTCNEGTTSATFVGHVQRRINYYRALAGIPATIAMNSGATIVTGDPYAAPSSTTKTTAASKAALLLSKTNILTHTPSASYSCFTAAGGNGSYYGNIAIGYYGAGAIDAYITEDITSNVDAGHRRWIFYMPATDFATGDISATGTSNSAASSLYVRQNNSELATVSARFIPWPAAGFVPWQHSTPLWSLSYPAADFSAATVAVTNASGVPQTVSNIRKNNGYGHNGMTWQVAAVPTSGPDTTYNVAVSGIAGDGVPTTYNYSFTFFNPNNLATAPTLSGSLNPPLAGANYTIGGVSIAEEYRLEVGKKTTASWTEGAEDSSASFVIAGPVTGYAIRATSIKRSGAKAFNLAYTSASQTEQWIELDRVIIPKASATLKYYRQVGYMSSGSTFVMQYSLNDNGIWTDIAGTAKAGTSSFSNSQLTESAFTSQLSFALPAETLNTPTRIRMLIRKAPAQEFVALTDGSANYSGVFIDDITLTNCDWLSTRTLTNIPSTSTFVALNAASAGETLVNGNAYTLRLQPRIATKWMTASTIMNVVTGSAPNVAPTLNLISNPAAILEDAAQQTINLTGITAGASESQTLTLTATSSNTDIIPHPTVSYTSPNATGSLSYTPVANANGTATITVTVNDGQDANATISRTFTVNVTAVNDAPTITAFAPLIMVKSTTSQPIAFTIGDIDTTVTSLTFSRTSSDTSLIPTSGIVIGGSGANRTVTLTPAANRTGFSTITINVKDNALTTSSAFLLTVNADNSPPTITSIAAQTVTSNQSSSAIPFTIGDPENLISSLVVSANSSNTTLIPVSNITLAGSGTSRTIRLTPVANQSGTATITVTVSDGSSSQNTTFLLTVSAPVYVGFDAWVHDTYPSLIGSTFTSDYDKDGIPDGVEYAFSLDPTKSSNLGSMALNPAANAMSISMPLPTVKAGIIYGAEFSDGLSTWSEVGVTIQTVGGTMTATAPMGNGSRSMRWKITKP